MLFRVANLQKCCRPTGQDVATLVQLACTFECLIMAEDGPHQYNLKSLMSVSMLATRGTEVTFSFHGPDEAEAADALTTFIENGYRLNAPAAQ